MASYDLSGIPIPDRELMEINQNQVTQILEEIQRLKAIASDKSNPKAASAAKRLTNATRALADVVETPELFAGYTPTKGIKYLGEGYYGVGKKFLEDMQLDPLGLTGGKSTMHHNDSLKQLFQAIYHPDPNVRYRVLQGLREAKGGDIGSTLQNLSDTEAKGGHRLYHADPVTGKTDYKNKASTVTSIDPTASVEERIAAGTQSIEIQGKTTKAAQQADIVQVRNASMLEDILATPGGKELLDRFGNPLDINNPLRTPEAITAFRQLETKFKPVLETVGGVVKVAKSPNAKRLLAALPIPVLGAIGDIAQAAEGAQSLKQDTTTKSGKLKKAKAKTDVLAGAAGLGSLIAAPVLGPMSLIAGAGSMILGGRIEKEEEKERRLGKVKSRDYDLGPTTITKPAPRNTTRELNLR